MPPRKRSAPEAGAAAQPDPKKSRTTQEPDPTTTESADSPPPTASGRPSRRAAGKCKVVIDLESDNEGADGDGNFAPPADESEPEPEPEPESELEFEPKQKNSKISKAKATAGASSKKANNTKGKAAATLNDETEGANQPVQKCQVAPKRKVTDTGKKKGFKSKFVAKTEVGEKLLEIYNEYQHQRAIAGAEDKAEMDPFPTLDCFIYVLGPDNDVCEKKFRLAIHRMLLDEQFWAQALPHGFDDKDCIENREVRLPVDCYNPEFFGHFFHYLVDPTYQISKPDWFARVTSYEKPEDAGQDEPIEWTKTGVERIDVVDGTESTVKQSLSLWILADKYHIDSFKKTIVNDLEHWAAHNDITDHFFLETYTIAKDSPLRFWAIEQVVRLASKDYSGESPKWFWELCASNSNLAIDYAKFLTRATIANREIQGHVPLTGVRFWVPGEEAVNMKEGRGSLYKPYAEVIQKYLRAGQADLDEEFEKGLENLVDNIEKEEREDDDDEQGDDNNAAEDEEEAEKKKPAPKKKAATRRRPTKAEKDDGETDENNDAGPSNVKVADKPKPKYQRPPRDPESVAARKAVREAAAEAKKAAKEAAAEAKRAAADAKPAIRKRATRGKKTVAAEEDDGEGGDDEEEAEEAGPAAKKRAPAKKPAASGKRMTKAQKEAAAEEERLEEARRAEEAAQAAVDDNDLYDFEY